MHPARAGRIDGDKHPVADGEQRAFALQPAQQPRLRSRRAGSPAIVGLQRFPVHGSDAFEVKRAVGSVGAETGPSVQLGG